MAANTYQAIRDCGYGKVWTRLCADRGEAIAEVERWKKEGRSDAFINGGEYFIRPIREVPNAIGGFHSEPLGEVEAR